MDRYLLQDSPQTLAEGLREYYAAHPGLAGAGNTSPKARQFFRCHDTAHVVFGCGITLDDEAVVKIASIFGTTARLRVLESYRLHESMQTYKQLSLRAVLKSITHSAIVVPRTVRRCLGQSSRWPWEEFEPYLVVSLRDIRRHFGITVAHRNVAQ